ncbi:YcjF family protein [Roseibium algae]|uniref:TIGR01620 family protein n=1 Tax=Roseibium algae TaxID=3123038 RepID=A0ABU8TKZ6_9HYPH
MTKKSDTGARPGPQRANRRPAAFSLNDERVRYADDELETALSAETLISPDTADEIELHQPLETSHPKKGISFGKWIGIGLTGLVSLSVGLAIDGLIRVLFARTDWLGWTAIGLTVLCVLGLFGLIIRECLGVLRVGKIDHLRDALTEAANTNDTKKAQANLNQLMDLYTDRPETARGRKVLKSHMREVIDGRDLIILAERDLLSPIDLEARHIVMSSAKRVSLVTAISPRALVDLLAVLFENMRIIRRLSALYGGRPGSLGFFRLARQVVTHLALTGGMAAGDSLASQVLGHGLAARLSARLGEGVINGLLTARIGIAAIAVCRPAPFVAGKGPTISDFMGELMRTADEVAPKK